MALGRALAAHGVRAVRIDYEGHGDSDGETTGLGLADWTDDVCDAAASLSASGVRRLTLLGCRAGALIAARAAARTGAERLVLWCPVVQGDDHLQDLLRLNLTTQMAVYKRVEQNRDALTATLAAGNSVNIFGWNVGRALLESLTGASLADALATVTCPVEILDLTRRPGDPPPAAAAALASRPGIHAEGVPGMQFWIDSNYIDFQQAGLVQATAALVGAPPA